MSKKEILKRYLVFLVGLYINSFGVAVITKANLGTSPISSIPYVLSLRFPFTLGQFTIVFNILLILLQIALLRKRFKIINLLQLPVTVGFGYFIDLSMVMLGMLDPINYVFRLVVLVIGCIILGFGVYIEVVANVVMLPGESFVRAVTQCFGTEFGITKICFDVSMSVAAGIISVVSFHRLNGVGVGTVVAALLVGFLARRYSRWFPKLPVILFGEKKTEEKSETVVNHHIITISREFGSGGREIGKRVAEQLGVKCYDDELLSMTADALGKSENFVEANDQKLTGSLLFDIYRQVNAYSVGETEKLVGVFGAESELIRKIADRESCVIVGRLANFVLENYSNTFHVFIHANKEDKIRHIVKRDGISEARAEEKIRKVDRERREHCKLVTGKEWGHSSYYDLALNTSDYGIEGSADWIVKMATAKVE